jgi:serine phosphatase RsbU (regulator of sigma subunit)
LYVIRPFAGGSLVGVADGLGHGPAAAAASRLCGEVLEEHAEEPLTAIISRCHERLRGTRGVALSLASFNLRDGTLTWLSVGNVGAVLLRRAGSPGPRRDFLLLRSGVLGGRLPRLSAKTVPIAPGDTLILATDGVRANFSQGLEPDGSSQEIAERILRQHATRTDDALVVVARLLERNDAGPEA